MKQENYNGTLQHPLGSGFGRATTAAEVIFGTNLTGKTAIVTGGNTGIGLETTKALVTAGASVIVPARDIEKARKNLGELDHVDIHPMDLMDPQSIDAFASDFIASGRPLHILINNAGIMWVPLRRNGGGIESQFATNYLAQFRLTARLWPALRQSDSARVVNVSSHGHHFATVDFDDPNFRHRPYETLLGYGQSKTAVNLFSVELANRSRALNVNVYAVHPGSIAGTELGREASPALFHQMGFCDAQGNLLPEVLASLKTIGQGAATSVWCATSPLLNDITGVYCEDTDIAKPSLDPSAPEGVNPRSLDRENCARLWSLTEKMTGIIFDVI